MNLYYATDYSPYLSHHGIKGQKWGVRRFQNPDGSLTAAGKKRYFIATGKDLSLRQERKLLKEARKLDKLMYDEIPDFHKEAINKYEARAKKARNVATTSGLVALANSTLGRDLLKVAATNTSRKYGRLLDQNSKEQKSIIDDAFKNNVTTWESPNKRLADNYREWRKIQSQSSKAGNALNIINNVRKAASIGSAATAGISAGVYLHSKINSSIRKRKLRDVYSGEAERRKQAQIKRMREMFGDKVIDELFWEIYS